jgi:hypothetical protein
VSGPGSPAVEANVDSGRYRPSRQMCVFSFHAAAHWLIVGALLLSGNAFACKPAPWGTGSYPVTSTNAGEPHADGEWAYWFCQDAFKTTWQMRLRKTGAPIEAFAAIEAANITLSLDDPSLAGLKEAALTHLDSRIPPDPTWAVAKNGTTLTRPIYARNEDGTLGALDKSARATVSAECQCADPLQRVVSGSSVYCAFRVEAPLRVTLCKPVP